VNDDWLWLAEVEVIVCAIAYEMYDVSLVSDYTWDYMVRCRNLDIQGWVDSFDPSTGAWAREVVGHQPWLEELTIDLMRMIEEDPRAKGTLHLPMLIEALEGYSQYYE
jgi:hypothetical protein